MDTQKNVLNNTFFFNSVGVIMASLIHVEIFEYGSQLLQISRSDVFLEATLELTVTEDLLAHYVADLGNIEAKWRKYEKSDSTGQDAV